MPDAVPRHQLAKQHAAVRDRPSVSHGDLGERDVLRDAPTLTRRITLTAACDGSDASKRRGQRESRAPDHRPATALESDHSSFIPPIADIAAEASYGRKTTFCALPAICDSDSR